MGTVICLALTNTLARIAVVRINLLVPVVVVVVFLASFQATRHYGDLISLLFFSLLGWFMKRFGWARPPLILGLVLSSIIENYMFISISRYGAAWLVRPGVIAIALLILASLYYGLRTTYGGGARVRGTSIPGASHEDSLT